MAVIDSYSETNQDSTSTGMSGVTGLTGFGQCFTGNGYKITDAKWYLKKFGSPTGNVVANIYTMTGTFGVNGNVGTLLATSNNVNATTLGTTFSLITFPFSGANQYSTVNGTHYVVTVEFSGGGSVNTVNVGYDGSSATHPGTWTYLQTGVWNPTDLGDDLCFYVDGVAVAVAAPAQFLSFFT